MASSVVLRKLSTKSQTKAAAWLIGMVQELSVMTHTTTLLRILTNVRLWTER
jgi:hypothetical protein